MRPFSLNTKTTHSRAYLSHDEMHVKIGTCWGTLLFLQGAVGIMCRTKTSPWNIWPSLFTVEMSCRTVSPVSIVYYITSAWLLTAELYHSLCSRIEPHPSLQHRSASLFPLMFACVYNSFGVVISEIYMFRHFLCLSLKAALALSNETLAYLMQWEVWAWTCFLCFWPFVYEKLLFFESESQNVK